MVPAEASIGAPFPTGWLLAHLGSRLSSSFQATKRMIPISHTSPCTPTSPLPGIVFTGKMRTLGLGRPSTPPLQSPSSALSGGGSAPFSLSPVPASPPATPSPLGPMLPPGRKASLRSYFPRLRCPHAPVPLCLLSTVFRAPTASWLGRRLLSPWGFSPTPPLRGRSHPRPGPETTSWPLAGGFSLHLL